MRGGWRRGALAAVRRTPAQRERARRRWAADNRRIGSIAAALDAYGARGGPMPADVFAECCGRVGVKLQEGT